MSQKQPKTEEQQELEINPSQNSETNKDADSLTGEPDLSALDELDDEGLDAPEPEPEPEPQPEIISIQDATAIARELVGQGMNATAAMYPELDDYFNDSMADDGAVKLAPVIVKHQGQVPSWLAVYFERYKEEFMAGVWFAGVAFGAVRHIQTKNIQEAEHGGERQY